MEEGDLHAYQKALKRKSQTPPYMEEYDLDDSLRVGVRFNAEELVSLVKTRRSLYDYNSKDYYNKEVVDLLWREVAAEMSLSVQDVKSKWMGLRNSYARSLRLSNSNESRHRKRRPWYLSEAMSFLNDFMCHNRQSGNRLESSPINSFEEFSAKASHYHALILNDESNASICDQLAAAADSTGERHRVRSPSPTPTAGSLVLSTDESNDPDLLFLRSMLSDIKKLSRKRRFDFKVKLMSLLNQMIDEDEEAAKSSFITVKEENED